MAAVAQLISVQFTVSVRCPRFSRTIPECLVPSIYFRSAIRRHHFFFPVTAFIGCDKKYFVSSVRLWAVRWTGSGGWGCPYRVSGLQLLWVGEELRMGDIVWWEHRQGRENVGYLQVMWYDMIYDMMWYMLWHVMMWHDMIWWYMIWYVICCMVWYDVICYDMTWYDIYVVAWDGMIYDVIWYDMIWYGMIWYDIFVKCNWVATRWQQYSTHLHTYNTQNNTIDTNNTQNDTIN